jgi:hypothetical protein
LIWRGGLGQMPVARRSFRAVREGKAARLAAVVRRKSWTY